MPEWYKDQKNLEWVFVRFEYEKRNKQSKLTPRKTGVWLKRLGGEETFFDNDQFKEFSMTNAPVSEEAREFYIENYQTGRKGCRTCSHEMVGLHHHPCMGCIHIDAGQTDGYEPSDRHPQSHLELLIETIDNLLDASQSITMANLGSISEKLIKLEQVMDKACSIQMESYRIVVTALDNILDLEVPVIDILESADKIVMEKILKPFDRVEAHGYVVQGKHKYVISKCDHQLQIQGGSDTTFLDLKEKTITQVQEELKRILV